MITTTDETGHDEILDRLAELGVHTAELLTEDGWIRYLDAARKFHSYSVGNQILIAFQRPDATVVAGYGRWKDLDRQVMKGEKGIKIWAPNTRKQVDDDGTEHRRLLGFHVVSVFDVSQTAGDPLPERPVWPMLEEPALPGLFDEIAAQAAAVEGIDVWAPRPDEGEHFGARGWYNRDDKRIAVRIDQYSEGGEIVVLPPAQRIKTLLHELGHHFDPELGDSTRAEREIVAESVSWLACSDLHLDATLVAASYLAGWDPTGKGLIAVGNRVKIAYAQVWTMLASVTEDAAEVAA